MGSTRRGQRIARRIRRVQSQIEHELERWGEIGWVEEQAGRAVAATLLAELYTEVLAEIGESPELQRLIEESSAGLTRSVIGELRERSANADERVESIIRRLRRRH